MFTKLVSQEISLVCWMFTSQTVLRYLEVISTTVHDVSSAMYMIRDIYPTNLNTMFASQTERSHFKY
jgi:hypothetical protein